MFKKDLLLFLSFIMLASNTQASESVIQACMIKKLKTADLSVTIGELKKSCEDLQLIAKENKYNEVELSLEQDLKASNLASSPYVMTPYVMTPHKMNYLLPARYSDNVNTQSYEIIDQWAEEFKNVEIKYQLSFRVPLLTQSLFTEGDGIAFAFTLESWWQLYAQKISRPFRETNYQPEFFYYTPLTWQPLEGNTALLVGFEHQSNGHSSTLSRSWNRVYANFIFAKDDFTIAFRPWWRVPEGKDATTLTNLRSG